MSKKKRGGKKFFYISFIIPLLILLLFLLGYFFFSFFQESNITGNPIVSFSDSASASISSTSGIMNLPEQEGYIIELKSEPFLKKSYLGLGYRQTLNEEHVALKQQIKQILNKDVGSSIILYGEFQDTFNGLALDINSQECQLLKSRINLIKSCSPNYKVHVLLDKSKQVTGVNSAESDFNLTGKGITIAVLDTGIDGTHESLDDLDDDPLTNDPKIIGWKDYVNFRTIPYDDHGHGTHCSGIATGTGGSSIYRGIAPGANLVGVKVLDSGGSGTFSDIIAGIEWTIQNKAKYNISIISMSLGANVNSDGTTPVEIAATTATESGIIFVVAAGNAGFLGSNSVGIPASAKKVITVGAVDNNKEIAYFSSRGPTKDNRTKPEVSAPGVSIISSVPKGNCNLCSPSGYNSLSGTSMATPYVAGMAALLKEASPNINPEQVRQILMDNAEDRGIPGRDNDYGAGVVDFINTILKIKPQQHELVLTNLNSQNIYDIAIPIPTKVNVKNWGLSNETNLVLKFYVDGVEQANRQITRLDSGENISVDFFYAATREGSYNFSVSLAPVSGETLTRDNSFFREINVKAFAGEIKVVVLDSWGSEKYIYSIFPTLSDNWVEYGEYKLNLDYKSLNKKEVTSALLASTGADVLIISDAWQDGGYIPGSNWEFSDSEIAAIKQYVLEGHGLIVTSGTLSVNTPGNVENNMKLASLFGIDSNLGGYWAQYLDDGNFEVYYPQHVLFKNISSLSDWSSNNVNLQLDPTNPGDLLAQSLDNLSIVTGYHYGQGNTIYFANMPESSSSPNARLFYNSILWVSQKYSGQRNLKMSEFSCPTFISYNSQVNVSGVLINNGNMDETNISVKLLIDDNVSQTLLVPSLDKSSSKNVTFTLSLDAFGAHEVQIVVEPSTIETYSYDNSIGKKVFVPAFNLLKILDYGVDDSGNGLYEKLTVQIELDALKETDISVEGLLGSKLGVSLSEVSSYAHLSTGLNNLTLIFNGLQLRKMGLNGPYDLSVLKLTQQGEESLTQYFNKFYSTFAYVPENFDSYPDVLLDSVSSSNYNVYLGDSFEIIASIANYGTEDTGNISVIVTDMGSNIIIASKIIDNLAIGEVNASLFKISPESIGGHDYLINVSDSRDLNKENDVEQVSVYVREPGPYIYGHLDYSGNFVEGNYYNLTFLVINEGNLDASNVRLSFIRGFNQGISYSWGLIRPGESKQIIIPYFASKAGYDSTEGLFYINDTPSENTGISLNVLSEGLDVSGSLYPSYQMTIGEPAEISFDISNRGSLNAKNVNAKIYVIINDSSTLLKELNFANIEFERSIYDSFSWIPQTLGSVQFKLQVSVEGDLNPENNEVIRDVYIKSKSPDLGLYLNYDNRPFVYNSSNNLSLTIYNEGFNKALNSILNVYEWDNRFDNLTLIGSRKLGDLSKGSTKVEFQYIPLKKGWAELRFNVSCDNEDSEYQDNNVYYLNKKVLAGADLEFIELQIPKVFANQKAVINGTIRNSGIKTATNVYAKLYNRTWDNKIEGYSYVLLNSTYLGNLSADGSLKFTLNYTFKNASINYVVINLSCSGEDDLSNNEYWDRVVVLGNGPDLSVNILSDKLNDVAVDSSVNIPVKVSNEGNQNATNFLVSLFEVNYSSETAKFTKIGSVSTVRLDSGKSETYKILFTPRASGWNYLFANVSVTSDTYFSNNQDSAQLYAYETTSDVSVKIYFSESSALTNSFNKVDLEIKNKGQKEAKNIMLSLYDNQNLIYSSGIDNLPFNSNYYISAINWTPVLDGVHTLKAVVSSSGDSNSDNDVYFKNISSYSTKNLVLNIKNYSGSYVARYFSSFGNKMWVAENKYETQIMNSGAENKYDLGFDTMYFNDEKYQEGFVTFLNSEISEELNLTTQYYGNLTQSGLLFDIVYVNSPNWNYSNLSYALMSYDPLKNFAFADVYSCASWNFENVSCGSTWIKNSNLEQYAGSEGVYASGTINGNSQAIGLVTQNISSSVPSGPSNPGSSGSSHSSRGSGSRAVINTKVVPSNNGEMTARPDTNMAVEMVNVHFKKEQQTGYIRFSKIEFLPGEVSLPSNKVYSFFEINHDFKNEDMAYGDLVFKVEKSWFEQNKLSKENIVLNKYEGSWRTIPTSYQKEDNQYYYYSSEINSLSLFAITSKSVEEINQRAINQTGSNFALNYSVLIVVGVILIILAIILIALSLLRRTSRAVPSTSLKIEPSVHEAPIKDETDSLLDDARSIVADAKAKGYSNSEIRKRFKESGWDNETINSLLKE